MKNKTALVVPYFGKLPVVFPYWLKSAVANEKIDFHLITDQIVGFNLAPNIFVHSMEFASLNRRMVELLGASKISSPYKLCDFKPTYGHLFEDILDGYDSWGYSDIDLVFGDLDAQVISPGLLGKYDKVFDLGHLSFYRNVTSMNRLYSVPFKGCDYWPYIRDSKIIWVFDELYRDGMGGINGRVVDGGYKLFSDREKFSDIHPGYSDFFDVSNPSGSICFFCLRGKTLTKTFVEHGVELEVEVAYAHFQKRELKVVQLSPTESLFLPASWEGCSTYNDAVSYLRLFSEKSQVLNGGYVKWKAIRKRRKFIQLAKELFYVSGAFSCVRSLL